jgi:biopolymer transport protein ExbD
MAGAISNTSDSDDGQMMSTINVTPFVDVVLVLLVIFMITAPMLVKEMMEIRLPKTASGDGSAIPTLAIAVNRSGQILLDGQIVDDLILTEAAKTALQKNVDAQAIIAADTEVAYGKVVKVIDILKSSGLSKFAVQIEREKK